MMDRSRVGDISELGAVMRLLEEGYDVFRNVSCVGPADIVAWKPGEAPLLFDVKTLARGRAVPKLGPDQVGNGVEALGYNRETDSLVWGSGNYLAKSTARPDRRARGTRRAGESHGLTGTYWHQCWLSIRTRCFNEKIGLHPAWDASCLTFKSELESEIGPRPSDEHSLCRIDNERNYEPGNLRWATTSEKCRGARDPSCDIAGIRFGRLVAMEELEGLTGNNGVSWLCQCDCGAQHTVVKKSLLKGLTTSCGCYNSEVATARQERLRAAKEQQSEIPVEPG